MTAARMVVCLLVLAGCRRAPQPVYEYEPPVTITGTDAPGAGGGTTTTTLAPRGSPWQKGSGR